MSLYEPSLSNVVLLWIIRTQKRRENRGINNELLPFPNGIGKRIMIWDLFLHFLQGLYRWRFHTTSWLGVGFRIAAALFQTCNQAHHEEGWKWWCFPKHSRSSIYADARIWVPWQDILTTPQKTTGKVCVQNSWQNVVWWWKTLKAICFVWTFSDFDLTKMCWNFCSIHWMFYFKL